MGGTDSSSYGPGWADVGQAIRAFQRKWGGSITVSVRSSAALGRSERLWVVCQRLSGSGTVGDVREQFVGDEYPSRYARTMPQLMHELLYRLDGELEVKKVARERQTSF